MDFSAWELLKYSKESNEHTAFLETPLINFGRIIKVIDIQTVIVESIVQVSLSKEIYTVTLLNSSSALLEVNVYPKKGDKVLLLFTQRFDPKMFMKDSVKNPNAHGYDRFTGVGMLVNVAKGLAKTLVNFFESDGKPKAEIKTSAGISGVFNSNVALTFCRAVFSSKDEEMINAIFGEGRPFSSQFLDKYTSLHGFWRDNENELIELIAPVFEAYSIYSPITRNIQGTQTTDIGLGKDKDDEPIETKADIKEVIHGKAPTIRDIRSPQTITVGLGNDESKNVVEEREASITETIHGKSPINRDIRSPQTIIIGIGNDESGDATEQRTAPVHYIIGEDADITIESKSRLTGKFQKEILFKSPIDIDIESDVPIGIKGSGTQLGGGNLRPFWSDLAKAAGRNPIWIPPVKWPKFVPVPPVPPLQNMAIFGFLQDIIAACQKAISTNNKVLK